tara:strand:- start:2481 stop:2822 length:342 start_codon:yes stop_codon:yes gene_type:complete
MIETTNNYGKITKRIVFNVTDHEHAQLIIRLRHNSLTQSEFFKAIIEAVNANDEHMVSFISDYASKKQKLNKNRIKKNNKLLKIGQEKLADFSLSEDEVEDVFDLIAEEFPEL